LTQPEVVCGNSLQPDSHPVGVTMGVTVPSGFPKQAIVVIHGMGEQKPMDTIKNFAHAVWTADSEVHKNGLRDSGEIWSKPDDRTGSLELRRLTTRESTPIQEGTYPGGARQDFYELYWADLSGGSTLGDVQNWVRMLLLRNPFTRVPRRMMTAWMVLWIVVLVILLLVTAAALPAPVPAPPKPERYDFSLWNYPPYRWLAPIPGWALAGIVAGLGYVAHTWVVNSFGRVVRYTRALPDNIAARKAIRERGLKLLDDLHRAEYDRSSSSAIAWARCWPTTCCPTTGRRTRPRTRSRRLTQTNSRSCARLRNWRPPWRRKRILPAGGPCSTNMGKLNGLSVASCARDPSLQKRKNPIAAG